MIGELMKAQAAAHRSYLISTAAMLTLGVALAGYAALSAAQQDAVDRNAARAFGVGGVWSRHVYVHTSSDGSAMTHEELDAALDAADAEGARSSALHRNVPYGLQAPVGDDVWSTWNPAGVRGEVDWDALLLSGEAPGPGEVAVEVGWETSGGLALGDTMTVVGDVTTEDGEWTAIELGTLTVSGFLRPGAEGRYGITPFDAVLTWDDSWEFWDAWLATQQNLIEDEWGTSAEVGAQRVTPALDAVTGEAWDLWFGGNHPQGLIQILAFTAAVLGVAMIGLAFAVGRAQAQTRSRWVATARALGARRSAIAVATVAEVALVGLAAGVAGVAIAWGAVALEYAAFAGAHPDALLPAGVEVAPWVLLAIGSLGLAMAAILGAIPAFWAMRTPPAVALKPETPVSEARVGPRIRSRWIVGTWGALFVATVALGWPAGLNDARQTALIGLILATMAATVPALVRAARLMVAATGRRLARGSRPWAIAAGDALTGRPRLASIPAGVMAVVTAALVAAMSWHLLAEWGDELPDTVGWGWPWLPRALQVPGYIGQALGGDVYVMVAALGIVAVVLASLAAFVAAARATAPDDQARRALGLSAATARAAMAARFAVPLILGALLGATAGVAGTLLTYHGSEIDQTVPIDFSGTIEAHWVGPAWALANAGHLLLPVLAVIAVASAAIAIGAAFTAALVPAGERPRVSA
ncbi:FtsX-like permease family protein [Demequina iriomotensis]|uniref:FtsX-like permease family protein n=1 Tax=Demequina iriomotensis TaxID=1536641 RepID=UPI0007845575|nr:FtsX-like permease family protein [Demequina iriomotensis]